MGGSGEIRAGKCVNVNVSGIVLFLRSILGELLRAERTRRARQVCDTPGDISHVYLMLIARIFQLIYVSASYLLLGDSLNTM